MHGNRLIITTVKRFINDCVNDPPLALWNAENYVISMLKSGKYEAWIKLEACQRQLNYPDIVPNHLLKLINENY